MKKTKDVEFSDGSKRRYDIYESMIMKDRYFYIGGLTAWGECPKNFATDDQYEELVNISSSFAQKLKLSSRIRQAQIDVSIPFDFLYRFIQEMPNLGKVRYFCKAKLKSKDLKNQYKRQLDELDDEKRHLQKQFAKSKDTKYLNKINKRINHVECQRERYKSLSKKTVAVRIEIYLNKNIMNECSNEYLNNLKKVDEMQAVLSTMKASSREHNEYKRHIENFIETNLYKQKIVRSFLMYLMQKANVKVLNRSFVKPPAKLNFMMRQYRKNTIGLITKNRRNEYKIQHKIQHWKNRYQYYCPIDMSITPFNKEAFEKGYYNISKEVVIWNEGLFNFNGYGQMREHQQNKKLQFHRGYQQPDANERKQLERNRKKIMEQIGAFGFDGERDQSQSDQQQNEASKKSMDVDQYKIMKKNEALMQRFETENKYFKKHPNPPTMISTLKPYQAQALTWMKYREGKIKVQDLFEDDYEENDKDFAFQRKLSPFWEEVQMIGGQKFFINYLTGQYTKKFNDWRSIKGGILADQMGLGKTVMTLSLLADENWQGINLIVVPVAVLLQWKQQIQKHCGPSVLVYEFHSQSTNRRKKNLKDYQIVLVTYATLGHQWKNFSTKSPECKDKFIFQYDFQRVILDEAHNIRGTGTLQFNAVLNVKSKYSWCLTGTLIQNSEQDLFAIFKFLKVQVFSQQVWWNQYIKNTTCTQTKMNVIQTVLRPIVLRRTKASTSNEGQSIIQLTKKYEHVIRPTFSKVQATIYQQLQQGVKKFFRTNVEAGKNYTHIFQIISKLRQFCCHPALIFGDDAENIDSKDVQGILHRFLQGKVKGTQFKKQAVQTMLNGDETCVICLTQPDEQNAVLTQCGHFYCEPCLKRLFMTTTSCPVCRNKLGQTSYIRKGDIMNTNNQSQIKNMKESSKITEIMKILDDIYERGEKCVIFTQWIKIISLLQEKILERERELTVIMGNMTVQKRQRAIRRFRQKDTCHFLIVSIRAGATGLNLAFANNVIICDPWWNPSHEDQAIGRVHRLGQTQEVNVYRFIMKSSIQQKIERMHVGKRKLANQVMMQKGSLSETKVSAAEELIRLLDD